MTLLWFLPAANRSIQLSRFPCFHSQNVYKTTSRSNTCRIAVASNCFRRGILVTNRCTKRLPGNLSDVLHPTDKTLHMIRVLSVHPSYQLRDHLKSLCSCAQVLHHQKLFPSGQSLLQNACPARLGYY